MILIYIYKNTKLSKDITMYNGNGEDPVKTLCGIFFQKLLLEGVLMKRHINEDPGFKLWYKRPKIIVMATLYGTHELI